MSEANQAEADLDGKHPLFYKGDLVLRVYVLTVGDESKVYDFLMDREQVSKDDFDGLVAILKMIDAKQGTYSNGRKFKKLEDYRGTTLLELKREQVRIGCFWHRTQRFALILAYGCIKKGDDWKEGDLKQFQNACDAYWAGAAPVSIEQKAPKKRKGGKKNEKN